MDLETKFTNNLCHELWGEEKQELVNQERFFKPKKKGDSKTHIILDHLLQIEMFRAKLRMHFDKEKTHLLA